MMIVNGFILFSLIFYIYLIAPKVYINPQPYTIEDKILAPPKDAQRISWNNAVRYLQNKIYGPESLTYDPNTGDIYTGTHDGLIQKINKELTKVETIMRIAIDHPDCGSKYVKKGCGRLLGLEFVSPDKPVVADSYQGIIIVDLKQLTKRVLVGPNFVSESEPIKFFNSVDVASNGMIYFTVSTMKWYYKDFVYSLLENENSGRLYSFNSNTTNLKVLASNISFANGLCLAPDEKSLIFSELLNRRIFKINLLNENEKPKIFINHLPGYPDNIKIDKSGNYYVAMIFRDSVSFLTNLFKSPKLLRILAWFVPKGLLVKSLISRSLIYKINNSGKIVAIVDGTKPGIEFLTEAHEINGKILLGNLYYPYLDVVHLK